MTFGSPFKNQEERHEPFELDQPRKREVSKQVRPVDFPDPFAVPPTQRSRAWAFEQPEEKPVDVRVVRVQDEEELFDPVASTERTIPSAPLPSEAPRTLRSNRLLEEMNKAAQRQDLEVAEEKLKKKRKYLVATQEEFDSLRPEGAMDWIISVFRATPEKSARMMKLKKAMDELEEDIKQLEEEIEKLR